MWLVTLPSKVLDLKLSNIYKQAGLTKIIITGTHIFGNKSFIQGWKHQSSKKALFIIVKKRRKNGLDQKNVFSVIKRRTSKQTWFNIKQFYWKSMTHGHSRWKTNYCGVNHMLNICMQYMLHTCYIHATYSSWFYLNFEAMLLNWSRIMKKRFFSQEFLDKDVPNS